MLSWSDLRREPFRVYFPLGMFLGLLGADHWLVYALGVSPSYSGFYHASVQVGGYLSCFIVGFLLTALPRFASAAPATSVEWLVIFALCVGQPLLLSLGRWIAAEACFAGLLIALAAFALRRFAARRADVGPPTEFVWIPIALLHGLVGAALLILGQAELLPGWVLKVGRPMAQQGFLLSIVLGVGGFMAPRLMGRARVLVTPATGADVAQARRARMRRMCWHAFAGLLLFLSFWIEGHGALRLAYGLRASLVTAELAWTSQFYRAPKVTDLYVQFVSVSLWMIVVGLWAAVFAIRVRIAMLHLVFLGGFSLMVFGVATMVVLSHSGEGRALRGPLWVLRVVAVGVAVAIIARVMADWMPSRFFALLAVAAALWSIAGVSWLVFALPYVMRPVPAETFERVHREAKQELLKHAS